MAVSKGGTPPVGGDFGKSGQRRKAGCHDREMGIQEVCREEVCLQPCTEPPMCSFNCDQVRKGLL